MREREREIENETVGTVGWKLDARRRMVQETRGVSQACEPMSEARKTDERER